MLKIEDIDIEDCYPEENFVYANFQFTCDYELLGITVPGREDGEYANLYVRVNPFTNEVHVIYDLSIEDYANIYECPLNDDEKKIFREAAENFIQEDENCSIAEICEAYKIETLC